MTIQKRYIVIILLITNLLIACNYQEQLEQANQQFGDQHFKTAIALIELHKIRFGQYPESLDSLKYTGDWDKIIEASVSYQKLDTGYVLDLTDEWMGKRGELNYPDDFWKGLGLIRSNLKK